MKVVVQCCAKKNGKCLRRANGVSVRFVAHPEWSRDGDIETLVHPDGPRDELNDSWRDYLTDYNQTGENPLGLSKAWQLYVPARHDVYRRLVDRFGERNVFIFSAGWGLVRSDFLTPYYDVTFSGNEKDADRKRLIFRGKKDIFDDYNYLTQALKAGESVLLFLTNAYLSPYRMLNVNAGSVWSAAEEYEGRKYTNWHYDYINQLLSANDWPSR